MMNLYEITNDYIGESYFRVYAWAKDEEIEALQKAKQSFKADSKNLGTILGIGHGYDPRYWLDLRIKFLFSADSEPFVTEPSDSGFELASCQDETQEKE